MFLISFYNSYSYFSILNQSTSAKPASFVMFVLLQNNPTLAPTQRPGFAVNLFERCPEPFSV
jgi:hypothetical protein